MHTRRYFTLCSLYTAAYPEMSFVRTVPILMDDATRGDHTALSFMPLNKAQAAAICPPRMRSHVGPAQATS